MTREEFNKLAAQGPIILDGATGSLLFRAGMPRGICTELWVREHPEVITEIQKAYADAGTQILYAPTFSANRVALKGFCLVDRLEEINACNVKLTKRNMEGRNVLVAGDMTTTGRMLGSDISYEKMLDTYKEQIKVLVDAGADLLIAETMLNVDETMVALDAALAVTDIPMMCTLTVNADGSGMYGGSAVEAVESLQAMGAAAVGLNCSVGPDQLEAIVRSMKKVAEVPVIAKPNAGMPLINEKGEAIYSMDPEAFAGHMMNLIDCGAGVVGGCCGTSPEYIAALARRLGRI